MRCIFAFAPGNVKISANIHAQTMTWLYDRDRQHRRVLALASYVSFLAARYFFVPRFPDEIHFGTTSDGWRIGVLRYRPRASRSPHGAPVLLVHGIAANRYNLDLTDETVAGRAPARARLRRLAGRAARPRLLAPAAALQRPALRLVLRRLRRARSALRRRHRHPRHRRHARSHLVGFSTGALACYAWLSDPHRSVEVASLVSIGGADLVQARRQVALGPAHPQPPLAAPSLAPARAGADLRLLAPVAAPDHPQPREHSTAAMQRRAMVNMIANFSRNELLQYSDWIMQRRLPLDRSAARLSRRARRASPCRRCSWPDRATCCRRPTRSRTRYDAVGVDATSSSCSARARRGMRVNYGHFDLVIGREAPRRGLPAGQRAGSTLSASGSAAPVGEDQIADAAAPNTHEADDGGDGERDARGRPGRGRAPWPRACRGAAVAPTCRSGRRRPAPPSRPSVAEPAEVRHRAEAARARRRPTSASPIQAATLCGRRLVLARRRTRGASAFRMQPKNHQTPTPNAESSSGADERRRPARAPSRRRCCMPKTSLRRDVDADEPLETKRASAPTASSTSDVGQQRLDVARLGDASWAAPAWAAAGARARARPRSHASQASRRRYRTKERGGPEGPPLS